MTRARSAAALGLFTLAVAGAVAGVEAGCGARSEDGRARAAREPAAGEVGKVEEDALAGGGARSEADSEADSEAEAEADSDAEAGSDANADSGSEAGSDSDARGRTGARRAWRPRDDDPRRAEHPIEDPSHVLDHFYRALAASDDGVAGAVTRVTHMGDSSIGMDQLPHYLRKRFQDRFGDGGTGFVLLQPHSPSYRNNTVHLSTPRPWDFCFLIFRCRPDGHYGLGGVSAESRGGATTVIATRDDGGYGTHASHLELWYAAQPRGGQLALEVDRRAAELIDTSAEALEDRFHDVQLDDGPHRVVVRAQRGRVRAYGVVLETAGPGVVWDTLSMIGAFTPRLLEQDEAHFAAQLARRRSNLVVLGYGGNDLRRFVGRAVTADELEAETRAVLERVRRARPEAGCLLTGVIEHERSGNTDIRPEHVEAVVEVQRRAARAAGCAFFDVYRAMGGAGSFAAWRRRGLAADDQKHLSPRGRRVVADWMYDALASGYVAFRGTHP